MAEHVDTGDGRLPDYADITVVCAHPDDESFGLGAIIAALADTGTRLRLVCLTAGEASTLGAGPELAERRRDELAEAALELGIDHLTILEHPDGALEQTPLERLVADVVAAAEGTEALLTFDEGGITGHADHERATAAAVEAGRLLDLDVCAWAIPEAVAATLREEFGAPFVGREPAQLDVLLSIDRTRQLRAIACHGSQLVNNPVPHRRIALQGSVESLRWLHRARVGQAIRGGVSSSET